MMWVLVLLYASAAITTIPGSYSTEEKCKEAAVAYMKSTTIFASRLAICIPAPDDIIYE